MTTLKTELGMKIKVRPSVRIAETVAILKDEMDVKKDQLEKRTEDLLKQMRVDRVTSVTAMTAGGGAYQFTIEDKGEAIKAKRIVKSRTAHHVDDDE